jgi:NAD+ synthetase
MIIGRNEPLDYKSVFETIVNVTSEYLTSNGIKAMVLGLSGGLDSTVCAAICKKVNEKTDIPFVGISLPCSTNKGDEISSAALAGEEFCNVFSEVNIQDGFECVEKLCEKASDKESTSISQGNIKARLRMITLYDIASKRGGIVIGTSNTTERLTGFWTLHGDEGDINPIGDLWKTEVYGLANYLYKEVFKGSEALKAAIEITPTDGNGVSGSDLDQIMPGGTYTDVDAILMPWVTLSDTIKEQYIKNGFEFERGTIFLKLCEKYGKDNVVRVIKRSVASEFKRLPHPIPIDVFRGQIVKKLMIE